jgi:hypothetical protein
MRVLGEAFIRRGVYYAAGVQQLLTCMPVASALGSCLPYIRWVLPYIRWVLSTRYSIGRQYVPLNESEQFARDALDMVEYVTGDASTVYGAMRAKAGHPSPFCSTMVLRLEVGNEENKMGADDYPAHYKVSIECIRWLYPLDVRIALIPVMVCCSLLQMLCGRSIRS